MSGFCQMRVGLSRILRRYLPDRRGNVSSVVAILIVPLVAIIGLATETASWFAVQRNMQNAADSAVIAAAQNDLGVVGGSVTYAMEAQAVTASYGFAHGTNNTTVIPAKSVTCPAPIASSGNVCYEVSISKDIPIHLTGLVGYRGTGDSGFQTVATSAIAGPVNIAKTDCIVSLDTGNDAFRINGAGGASIDLNGCNVASNGGTSCNGTNADGNVSHFFFAGSNKKCDPSSASSSITDPYLSVYPRSNIPANTCSNPTSATSYWQESGDYGTGGGGGGGRGGGRGGGGGGGTTTPTPNLLTGTAAVTTYCGDVKLTGNTTLTGSGTFVIQNGMLDLNGFTLTGTGVTIIFTGPTVGTNFNPSHTPPTSGTLDISAPTAGTWSGVAIYQDPDLTAGVDWSSAGNSLSWKVTGLIYMPKSDVSFKGAINKATGGANCFTMITNTFLASGTVAINETQAECAAAGLNTLPTSVLPRITLVQ